MTLKSSLRTATDEDGYIVQNHNINENFGETTADFLDLGGQNLNPKQVKRFQQSCPLLERRTKQIPDLNENMCALGYTSQNQSSVKGGGNKDVSSFENIKTDVKDESEDSISELSETSPLLGDFDEVSSTDEEDDKDLYSPSSNEIEDCNNNNRETMSEGSEYSVFSDSSEMSDCRKEAHFVLENNYNNNNNLPNDPIVQSNFRHHLHIDDEAKHAFTSKTAALFRDGGVTQTKFTKDFLTTFVASSNFDEFIPSPTNEYLTDVIPEDFERGELEKIPSNSEGRVNQIHDCHSKCIAEIDVNLVSSSFNNFTLSSGKHNDILSLVETEENQRQSNVQTTESKILNTKQQSLPRNMTEEYQYHLQNKICPKNGGMHLKQLADSPQDSFSEAKERPSPCIRCSQQNAFEDDSNNRVTNLDRASVVTNSECTCCLSTETSKFSSVAYEKNIQNLISPSRRDSLNSNDAIESDCVQNEFRTEPQLISNMDSGMERSPNWFSAENNPGSLDAESPTDNLIPAIPVSFDLLGDPDQSNSSTCGRYSALDNTVHDSSSTTTKSGTANCNENAHVKCKSVSPARELFGDFDVYNIETTMPTIDWAAMEAHLSQAAKEEDWLLRRHNDREEIRKKLAMDSDSEEYYCGEKVTKKPSLSTRLQSGMNLQICFMNEAASDQESQGSDQDSENGPTDENIKLSSTPTAREIISEFQQEKPVLRNFLESSKSTSSTTTILTDNSKENNTDWKNNASSRQYPTFFFARKRNWHLQLSKTDHHEQNLNEHKKESEPEENFYTCHARLQAEARMALAQAKEMARMQMEVERQKSKKSPIADIVGLPFPDNRSHINRQILADMNVAQLQVIVNDLHTQIENLNEELVQLLLNRDDLHMEQDSMLVDIEDLTRYLGAKDEALQNLQTNEENKSLPKLAQTLKKAKEK